MQDSKITIICPTLGTGEHIHEMLLCQTYKGDIEFIYVNNVGFCDAMNLALEKATSEIVVRIDDDVELPPRWLEYLVKPFEDLTVVGVTGPTFIPSDHRKNRPSIDYFNKGPSWLGNWLMKGWKHPASILSCGSVSYGSNFGEFIENKEYKIDYLESTNCAMRMEFVRKVGGYDEKFGDHGEEDLHYKLKKYGRLVYAPRAYLYHMIEPREARTRYKGLAINLLRFTWRYRPWGLLSLRLWIYWLYLWRVEWLNKC